MPPKSPGCPRVTAGGDASIQFHDASDITKDPLVVELDTGAVLDIAANQLGIVTSNAGVATVGQ